MKRSGPLKRTTPLERKTPLRRTSLRARRPKPVIGTSGPGTPWAQVRLVAVRRSGGRCERCGCPFVFFVDERSGEAVFEFDGHHRLLRSQGGPDLVANCAALCRACHSRCHAYPLEARALGFIVPSMHDPYTWAVILWNGKTVRLDEFGGYDECFDAA